MSPSRLLRVVVGNDCISQQCNKTLAIPFIENQKITFQPCDACTKCPNATPRTIQAWWHYYYVNGTRTDDVRVLSSPLHVEVASATPPTSTKLILFTMIPIVGVVLITGLLLLVVYRVYNFTTSRHHGDRPCKVDTLIQ